MFSLPFNLSLQRLPPYFSHYIFCIFSYYLVRFSVLFLSRLSRQRPFISILHHFYHPHIHYPFSFLLHYIVRPSIYHHLSLLLHHFNHHFFHHQFSTFSSFIFFSSTHSFSSPLFYSFYRRHIHHAILFLEIPPLNLTPVILSFIFLRCSSFLPPLCMVIFTHFFNSLFFVCLVA